MSKLSIFLVKIQFLKEKHSNLRYLQLGKWVNLGYLQKLALENQALLLFENFGKALLNKCHDVLNKFPGEKRLNFNLEAIYSHFKRCATYGTPCIS